MIAINIILYVTAAVVGVCNIIYLLKIITGRPVHLHKAIIAVAVLAVLNVICALLESVNEPELLLLFTVARYIMVLVAAVLSVPAKKHVSIYTAVLFMIIDSIVQSLVYILLRLAGLSFDRIIVLNMISIVINTAAFLFIRFILARCQNQVRNSIKIIPRLLYILLLISLMIVGELCGIIASDVSENVVGVQNSINNLLTVMTVLVFVVIIIYLVFNCLSKRYYESISEVLEKQVREQVNYYNKVDRLTQDIRTFRHDYKNHMVCLQALLEAGENDDALEYLRNITRHEILDSNKYQSGNPIADAILSDKNEGASKYNCEIRFDGFISDRIAPSDLCVILSNALDNAIEACAKNTSDNVKYIDVSCSVIKGMQIMRITNPNSHENDLLSTSKADKENHGFGLYNIRKTVERLEGRMIIPSQTPLFVLELTFKTKTERTN